MVVKQKIWESDKYLRFSEKGSLDTKHPGMKKLFEYAKSANKILDFGCGDGTRLSFLESNDNTLYGIDISKPAILRARKKYPKINFVLGDIKKAKFGNDFDLIYSAFVLEHTRKTEKILLELINSLRRGGTLLLMAPNYGAPNRASPVAKYKRLHKLITGFVGDVLRILIKSKKLYWREVDPITDKNYQIDLDTTIEPYLGTLVDFLSQNNMKIKETDTVWEREMENAKAHQKFFRYLGEGGIYPFKFWGPHLLVVAEKA